MHQMQAFFPTIFSENVLSAMSAHSASNADKVWPAFSWNLASAVNAQSAQNATHKMVGYFFLNFEAHSAENAPSA